ncbi:MAG: alcohol dehydrogenase catalytic domain-containing protein [Pseudomonadota bacterium]
MKALVYTGAYQLEMQDLPQPDPKTGQVIVDLAYCGLCGSDMHAYHGLDDRRVPPLVLGHEPVGVVRDGALKGKRVAINPLMSSATSAASLRGDVHLCPDRALIGLFDHGAFAEAVAIDEANLNILPDDLPFEQAVLAEPLAVCFHAARLGAAKHDQDLAGQSITVLGGGAIGLLAALTYKSMGVERIRIAEPSLTRAKLCADVTGLEVYNPIENTPDEGSVDIVFDAVGSGRTRAASCAMVRPGGTIVHVGLQDSNEGIDTRRITLQEITFLGTYCYKPDDFSHALQLLETGQVTGEGWTEFRPLEAGAQSFKDVDDGTAPPKIIFTL